jgi:hypothetical protein
VVGGFLSTWLAVWLQDRRSSQDRLRESHLKDVEDAIANVQAIGQMAHEALMAPRPPWFGSIRKLRALLYADVSAIPDRQAVSDIVTIANEALGVTWVKLIIWWLLPPRDVEHRKELASRLIALEARAAGSARARREAILTR